MSTAWRILCTDADLAVDCARAAERVELLVEPEITDRPIDAACRSQGPTAIAIQAPVEPAELVRLAHVTREAPKVPLAILTPPAERHHSIWLCADLGLVAVHEVRPLIATMSLLSAGAKRPWLASTRGLTALDRLRLGPDAIHTGRGGGRLARADDGLLCWQERSRYALLGEPNDAGAALQGLWAATLASPPARAVIQGVNRRQVQEVIFGPPRPLSDPASKAALEPYGLPLPVEELCTSPSRAAAEAARIGFPVRIALASPDLRLWDHPDLAVDGVDNAARVRDVYGQIMAMANERAPEGRLLGVHVTATTQAQAMLRVIARPLPHGFVLAELGFADPHGRAARDQTATVLPSGPEAIERVLQRLEGSDLLLAGSATQRKATVKTLADVLLRLAAFIDQHRGEVDEVQLNPLAFLVGGSLEIREACVQVGDAFLRNLEAPAAR